MDLLSYVENKQLKKQLPKIVPGHVVAVHQKIKEGSKERIQIFKGIVIRVKNGYGINGSFTVRRVASGVGVEKTFLFNSPLVEKIDVIKQAKTRRAKLYYLRGLFGKSAKLNLKGEKGEVTDLVREIVGEESDTDVAGEKDMADEDKKDENTEKKASEEKVDAEKNESTENAESETTKKTVAEKEKKGEKSVEKKNKSADKKEKEKK